MQIYQVRVNEDTMVVLSITALICFACCLMNFTALLLLLLLLVDDASDDKKCSDCDQSNVYSSHITFSPVPPKLLSHS